jgi:hypothetical protein
MPEAVMCAECAFRKTCETWKEPRNHVVSQICAAGPLPFYCHTGIDWQNPVTHILPARMLAGIGGLRVCEGWKRAVAARDWPGDRHLRRYQRWLAYCALLTFDRFLEGQATLRELARDLRPLAEYYRGPRAWQIARMIQR